MEAVRGFLRELDNGSEQHLAIVIPPGPGWPLPAYELALLIASDARGTARRPQITLVTPEEAPLAAFGSTGSAMVAEELEHAGVRIELRSCAEVDSGPPTAIILRPSGRHLEVSSVLALPRLRGRVPLGIPANDDGFVTTDSHARVAGVDHVWAAGDLVDLPIKFGGLATEQADAAAADILVDAGAPIERPPFRPVLRGQLLTSASPRYTRYGKDGSEVATHPCGGLRARSAAGTSRRGSLHAMTRRLWAACPVHAACPSRWICTARSASEAHGRVRANQTRSSSNRTAARVANTSGPCRWTRPAPARSRIAFSIVSRAAKSSGVSVISRSTSSIQRCPEWASSAISSTACCAGS